MNKKKFSTRFWEVEYSDSAGNIKKRLVQGPKQYRVSKVKKDLRECCPDMNILKVTRVSRPEWSVIFEERDE